MIQPSLAQILRGALAGAPVETRRGIVTGLGLWLLLMVLQGFDSANGRMPAAAAEFLSALCGSAGGILLAFTGLLNASAERMAGARRTGPDADGYRRVLLALPVLGVGASALLAVAVGLVCARAFLGAGLPMVIILSSMFLVLLALSAATVVRATRVLYSHAQLEAQDAAAARLAAGEARLSALQARMNPHFLFNALNTVAALVRTEPTAAERVTENLAAVLRMTLERSAERMSTLDAEVNYLRTWLAVERERWGDRLAIEWDVAAETLNAAVPPLILQPLVENSLRHAIGSRMSGGVITVTSRRVQGTKQTKGTKHEGTKHEGTKDVLELRVSDDGVGFPAVHEERTGLGNLRERLAAVYGEDASLTIDPVPRGAAVTIRLPFEETDARTGG